MWHLQHEMSNTQLEQLDLKVCHSRVARASSRQADRSRARVRHTATIRCLSEIVKLVHGQPDYADVRWRFVKTCDFGWDKNRTNWERARLNTPLHVGVAKQQSLSVELFLKREDASTLSNKPNAEGDTPLHLAVDTGNSSMIEQLLIAGADPLIQNIKGDTVLIRAVRAKQLMSVETILNNLQNKQVTSVIVGNQNKQGISAVFMAALTGEVEILKKLVTFGGNLADRDPQKNSMLHAAASEGAVSMVSYLLDCGNADVSVRNKYGWTPLHFAAAYGRPNVIEMLIENGAEVNALTFDGKSAATLAFEHNQLNGLLKVLQFQGRRGREGIKRPVSVKRPPQNFINTDKIILSLDSASMKTPRGPIQMRNDLVDGMQRLRVWPELLGLGRPFVLRN